MFLFSTDIDGTIYDGPESAQLFADFWAHQADSILIYNTGRSVNDTRQLIESTTLPLPRYITGGVGTDIYDCVKDERLADWSTELSAGWDFDTVDKLVRNHAEDIERQPEVCQNPYKCSWFWYDRSKSDIAGLSQTLTDAGITAQVVYSSDRDLDVVPTAANKGNAISWLAKRMGIGMEKVIVAGDSGNDASMFQLEGAHGIIPANAEPSLRTAAKKTQTFESTGICAAGIIEGIEHYTNKKL